LLAVQLGVDRGGDLGVERVQGLAQNTWVTHRQPLRL